MDDGDEKEPTYADSSGPLRGLVFALPISLALWAIIIGIIWLAIRFVL